MKYPQLVSSRAVNEISDWLVKRLEELDIEHPGVYSRLLLSLLHTPFKLNALDLDDIPQLKDLKQPYHLLNKNNEELKRLAAVQSLMEVSSVEQNKANIVNLVSELHSKLRKIENSEDNSLISSKIPTTQENFSETASSVTVANQQQQQQQQQKFYKNYKKIKRNHVVEPENPSKNYYLAFPALTVDKNKVENNKDKKDIAITVKKPKDYSSDGKVKSLCWSDVITTKDQQKRMDQTKQQFERSTSGNSDRAGGSNKSNVYFGSNKRLPKNSSACRFFYNNNNSNNNNNIEMQQHLKQMNKNYNQYSSESGNNFGQKKQSQVVKKKPKRQRNHFVFPSNINNKKNFSNKDQGKLLKKEYSSTVNSSSGNSTNISSHLEAATVGRNTYVPYQENIVSNAPWDMDFNGQWEMDQDLIKEFIQKEKKDEKINDAEFYNLSHDQALIIKCLPTELMDDPPLPLSYLVEKPNQKSDDTEDNIEDIFNKTTNYQITKWESDLDEAEALRDENYLQPVNVKEVQSINSFKSKFDDNVKALWDNDQSTFDAGKHSLSYEMNSLSLFNWQLHQEQEQQQQQQQQQYRNENEKYFYLNVNNMDYPTTISRSTSNNSSTGEKYIKSGTNLQQSIWSDNEGKIDSAESFSNKEIYQNLYDQQTVSDDFAENGQQGEIQQVIGAQIPRFMEITYDFVPQNDFVHSDSSPFQVYKPTVIKRPSKKMKSSFQIAPEGVMRVVAVTTPTSSDDLLTSEKTHFCPIKSSYNDGHTFSIDYSLDSVPYERSDTGSLYLNEKKFMKYKGGIRKYVLNHDYSDHEDSYYEEWEDKPRHLPNDGTFIIKFCCFSDNDKCCQTDNPQPIEFPAPKSYPSFSAAAQDFHNYHHFQKKNYISEMNDYYKILPGNDIGNTENFSFFTTTNARNGNGLEPNNYLFLTSNSSSSSISTMTSLDQPHSMPVDPFDTWRPKNDNFEGCIQSNHSLWEHCASCHESNDDGKSTTTAEGLMRDELRLDGDEIMSDLKYIQNLCITGNYEMQDTDDSEEPDEGFPENEEDFNMDDNKFYEHYYDIKKKYIIDSFVTHSNVTEDQIHIDEITLSKISNTVNEAHPNFAKYLKLFKLIKASFLNDINNNLDDNVDNNLNLAKMEKNRKRRHSTCQNFLEKKYFVHPGIPLFQNEQDASVYHPGSEYWDINVKKIVMFNNEAFEINGTTAQDDSDGINIINERKKGEDYYKQHAIIKYLDLARPLTR